MSYLTGHSRHSITVVVVSYNHQEVLGRAITSVLNQSIGTEVEIVISDDASTDRSFEIARHVAEGRSNVVVKRNAKNLGIMAHYEKLISEVTTEFVAILEGDDYWTDEKSLVDKLNFFRCIPNLECVFSSYNVFFEKTGQQITQPSLFGRTRNGLLYFEELLEENYIASFSNCMYRTQSLRDLLKEEVSLQGYDWLINLRMAGRGPIGFWKNTCATYVVHDKGTWSKMPRSQQIKAEIATLETLKTCTARERSAIIDQKIHRLLTFLDGV